MLDRILRQIRQAIGGVVLDIPTWGMAETNLITRDGDTTGYIEEHFLRASDPA